LHTDEDDEIDDDDTTTIPEAPEYGGKQSLNFDSNVTRISTQQFLFLPVFLQNEQS
jgi:hypothetical protein